MHSWQASDVGAQNAPSHSLIKWINDQFQPPEPAVKYTYNASAQKWSQENISVQLRPPPIAEGTNRIVYLLRDLSQTNLSTQQCVAKVSKEHHDGRQEYFADVVMQAKCIALANDFNSRNPPKRIRFLQPYVVELIQRPADCTGGPPLMMVEPMLEGMYQKHSNNWGFVDKTDRNTPQAFSHFTYHVTNGQCIVVDIQGVGDCYTDPQIHSNQPPEMPPLYGQGDMANCGIVKFFETHRCNVICNMLGLSTHTATDGGTQTRPAQTSPHFCASKITLSSAAVPSTSTSTLFGTEGVTSSDMPALVSPPTNRGHSPRSTVSFAPAAPRHHSHPNIQHLELRPPSPPFIYNMPSTSFYSYPSTVSPTNSMTTQSPVTLPHLHSFQYSPLLPVVSGCDGFSSLAYRSKSMPDMSFRGIEHNTWHSPMMVLC